MFANVSTDQLNQLQEIIQQLDRVAAMGDDSQRRRAPRLNIRTAMSVIVLVTTGQPSVNIYTRNISTSGMGYVSRRPFKGGEPIAISFRLPGQQPKLVLAKTTFCRYLRSGVYEMGAEFVESIADHNGKDRIPAHWLPESQAQKVAHASKVRS